MLNYCPAWNINQKCVYFLLQVEEQKVCNKDIDDTIILADYGDFALMSCGELELSGDSLFLRGAHVDENDKIISANEEQWKKVVSAVWRYNKGATHNVLEPEDIFILKEGLLNSYGGDLSVVLAEMNETTEKDCDFTKALCLAHNR